MSLLVSAMLIGGCTSEIELMPTPNLYADGMVDPFPDVPPEFQNNHAVVLYMTDRADDNDTPDSREYGYKRSRMVSFGRADVEFGRNVSWDDLVKASRSKNRQISLPVRVANVHEYGKFPPMPRAIVRDPTSIIPVEPGMLPLLGYEPDSAELGVEHVVQNELAERLSKTSRKEIYLFVHGYNNSFEDSVETIAQLWHFFGRQGVPIAYSWPAGSTGLLRGYTYDRESSEFTVFHLKQMIYLLSRCPDVEKINIISHSRGTDVTISALRELHMEIHGMGKSTRDVLKLGTVVLAAPDIDLDVVIQKFGTARLGTVPEHFTMYISSTDKALVLSNWLFSGQTRLGEINASLFTPDELQILKKSKTADIVNCKINITGALGHDYFHSNPAVSSDLVLLMRYHKDAGAENGRPLRDDPNGFWYIDDSYPGPEVKEQVKQETK